MYFSRPKMHPPVVATDEHRNLVRDKIEALASRRPTLKAIRVFRFIHAGAPGVYSTAVRK